MKSPAGSYFVKYLQLPANLSLSFEADDFQTKAMVTSPVLATPKQITSTNVSTLGEQEKEKEKEKEKENENENEKAPENETDNENEKEKEAEIEKAIQLFDINESRMLRLFSLFGSPLMKTQSVLKSYVETLSIICRSSQMKLTELELTMHNDDITDLVALIGDHVRCNDQIFNKLDTVARSIMNVPNNKLFKRLDHQWTINQTKQNTLLRTVQFFHSLHDANSNANKTAAVFRKIKSSDKTNKNGDDNIWMTESEQQQKLKMYEDCSKGLQILWEALDRCLTIFGYVPKDVLAAEMEKKETEEKDKKGAKKGKGGNKEENDSENADKEKEKKNENENENENEKEDKQKNARGPNNINFASNAGNDALKKKTEEENTRITSSVLRLKPLILAFFIVHDFYQVEFNTKSTCEEMEADIENNLASDYLLQRHEYFLNFTDKHRTIFNLLIAQKPQLLTGGDSRSHSMKLGPFAPLIWHPKRVLDLENKKRYLHLCLQTIRNDYLQQERDYFGSQRTHLEVRRKQLFNDSFCQMKLWTKQELMNRLSIRFLGEEGIDASGLTREWYSQLTKAMFDPSYCLFIPAADNNSVFQPNPHSSFNNDHIENFKFVGLFVAKAVFDGQNLEAYFTRSFLKHILHVKPTWEDLQSMDYLHYKNLKWMLENSIEGVVFSDFTYELEKMGVTEKFELRPNGHEITVTDANKKEYIELVSDLKMNKLVEEQTQAFLKGFNMLIPHWLISIFTWSELDLLICGMPDIDVVDWQNNTQYFGGYNQDSPQIKRGSFKQNNVLCVIFFRWFWETVQDMDKEERALLLQFVTGTSRVPLGGFANLPGMNGNQRFQIHSSAQPDETLPSAHTCFNQLDLPRYSTKGILKEKLLLAIRECSQGFGFA
ncbi:hypothetical protein RFI_10689 [Reticulomyxa filosa]|uniref:HECT-type E3 ubiquitin transferase n=1 Tax=Reticulomyxa filosa TaxID=46433 RepID=X6NL70_RETFI|nr:hypothetical protein RFI_10689 [Reticulomyxa filosa]|eukprot:ETO26449.1 hypothetical protein RFI_10689 [Reticulomyxa filosa]